MNLDEVVCACMNITNGMIKDAVEAGAKTLEDIQEQTGATTICGACTDDVQKALDLFLSQKGN
jgi:NAD(P)H-nitrite reductase large subunit